ncbi:MAG TPA: wax ester/triacylglycerol synthase family O-acyltransferase [Candidatus Binatia bacterium]|nr:wax ester/triacylglycerol synthase family O-acyltransferase [Candidatus Binatia bacterium]
MAKYSYERLTFLDNSFLIMEAPNSPMHIAGAATFEAGPLQTTDGGVDIDKIREYVLSRLHLIPRYRQRLLSVPVENNAVWVDDDHFNIHYHVRHTAVPKPGDERQLKRLAARIMTQHLDRQKPLWEIWIVEGLEDPSRFVMISKVHHCMVDGMSSVDLLNVLLTMAPSTEFEPAPRWMPRPPPTRMELAGDALTRYARIPLDMVQAIPTVLQEARNPDSDLWARLGALREMLGTGIRRVSETPLNQRIGPHRRFDWLAMDLTRIKDVKNRLGGTLNDIVLATVAGALRRFLRRRAVDVANLDFRVMAPVSVRNQHERGTLGNRVSAWMVPMPLGEPNPLRRLDTIRRTTEHLKHSKQALGAEVLSQVGEWTPSTLLSMGARLATRALPFNLVVTNVPGPQQTLYMLGAKMVDNYGFIPLTDYLCLGVVLFSYAGQLCWGFTAEWDLLPDLHDFVDDIEASFRELSEIPERAEVVARKPAHAKRPPRVRATKVQSS